MLPPPPPELLPVERPRGLARPSPPLPPPRAASLLAQEDQPRVTDAEYDALRLRSDELEGLFPELAGPASPGARLGPPRPDEGPSSPGGGGAGAGGHDEASGAAGAAATHAHARLPLVRHLDPLHSLDNVFEAGEAREFVERTCRAAEVVSLGLPRGSPPGASAQRPGTTSQGEEGRPVLFVAEPKIDGLTCALLYEGGRLVRAATRGDGTRGEDVTPNALALGEDVVPHRLREAGPVPPPARLEVRGEIYMPHECLARLNAAREAEGLPVFSTARNAAAGSLRQLDPGVVRGRGLGFFAYGAALEAPGGTSGGGGGSGGGADGGDASGTSPTSLADFFGSQVGAGADQGWFPERGFVAAASSFALLPHESWASTRGSWRWGAVGRAVSVSCLLPWLGAQVCFFRRKSFFRR